MHTNKGQDYSSLYFNLQALRLERQKKKIWRNGSKHSLNLICC